ncbi:vacuolar protein sorting-associated protein 13c [Phtheirospermum japonicum]|uniref:Vacuolar protein sorting-associated protein 13c n=1 Tax=Phtheirospermum japonicum TaxID=374723 RepID=A0A830CQ78_9LAMI|nr:vacuolar protein sorting-associated protein 13c [Phtheirospermum japonicum]
MSEGAVSVELERMAVYLDSDVIPWHIEKPWEDLLPSEWGQIFKFGTTGGKPATDYLEKHSYVLEPVSGNAMYSKDRPDASPRRGQPLQNAVVNLDDVTLCLSKTGYRDLLKLADNFTAFNQRLNYAHYRPRFTVKTDPRSWWKYAYRAVTDQMKKASGKMPWEQVLRYAKLRKRYISLYAALLKSDLNRAVVDDNEDIEELDRELDIEVIIQWRMLAHKFVEQSVGSDYLKDQKAKKSWWSFGWTSQTIQDESEPGTLTEEDWTRLNDIIGYKEGDDEQLSTHDNVNLPYFSLSIHMKHNASKLADSQECLADLSCDNLECCIKLYSESKIVDLKLGSYRLLSPNGLLAASEIVSNSLVAVFCYKPLDADVDWSLVAKASPCYVTYLKDSINQIINFFQSSATVSQTLVRETASAVQMTIDEVKRTAAKQVNMALKDRSRFFLDLDIAAPKITIPTDFYPDSVHPTKLLIDLGKLVIRSQDDAEYTSPEEMNMYSQFDLVLRDVSAFLVDGDYSWNQASLNRTDGSSKRGFISFLPVIDRCAVYLKLQQIRSPVASFPLTRLAMRLPSLGFHFSPSRYHRLMQVAKLFQGDHVDHPDFVCPWDEADFADWLYHLARKGVGGREAVWQRRYFCIVGPFLYLLDNPESRNYKQYFSCINVTYLLIYSANMVQLFSNSSLRGKHVYQLPSDLFGNVENVLAVGDAESNYLKVVEDANALILRCDSETSRRTWQSYLQGAIYRASATAPVTGLVETLSDSEDFEANSHDSTNSSVTETLFLIGVLDELKISFSYCSLHDQSSMKMLLTEEKRLLEFRAIGGHVELSIRANDVFIGTVLKALEIEDLVCRKGASQVYVARSFIRNADAPSLLENTDSLTQTSSEGDDEFYEASENLNDSVGSPMTPGDEMDRMSSRIITESDNSFMKAPSFMRVAGILPFDVTHLEDGQKGVTDALDSFVKAQIVILDQNSPLYSSVDTKVSCVMRWDIQWIISYVAADLFLGNVCVFVVIGFKPAILAIMEFVNAINIQEDNRETLSDTSSIAIVPDDTSKEIVNDGVSSAPMEEPVVKSLLGKGKSRVVFCLLLNMARAEIFLMKENESKLATLAQDNLLTDIKVFPSSFSIKASLGNLRISDDSLHSSHIYFWACDMRNPGGNSFVELVFCSFSADDDDYEGYDYSLFGELSEVRVVYLNRFLQEVISYFMGLVPNNNKDVIQIEDQVTNSPKWLTRSEIEGSPAVKLDLSLKKPIIVMPQRTNSLDYLKLDVVQITVQNSCRWFGGSKSDIKAVHVDILEIRVEDINLNVGNGSELGESIIQDVKGVSFIIQRSLRDLSHQVPSVEVAITIEELKAALSNKEYEIIMECAQANISETPNFVPPLNNESMSPIIDVSSQTGNQGLDPAQSETQAREILVATVVSVRIDMVELCLHYGVTRDASLATLQVSGVWLLYKSNTVGEGSLSATLKDLIVVDDREGTEKELRLAIGKPDVNEHNSLQSVPENMDHNVENNPLVDRAKKYTPAILILDAKFLENSTFLSLCIQRPQLLVALDFLLAIVEFFVPTVRGELVSDENTNSSHFLDALILDQPIFYQPSAEFSISPQKPLVADDERFDLFIYEGKGGILYLKDRQGSNLSCPSREALVYVGNGKKLQFRNVTIRSGSYFDSCILLGANSSYSANENDNVFLEEDNGSPFDNSSGRNTTAMASLNAVPSRSAELIFELQAIGPELTFYNKSRNAGQYIFSNKLLHAQMDTFCRLTSYQFYELILLVLNFALKIPFELACLIHLPSSKWLVLNGNTVEMSAEVVDLTMESNGITILEPFDASVKFSSASGKTSIQIGTIKSPENDHVYAFWRPRAPTGFAVLGDYLTPIDKPPTKGVIAVNTSLIRVKRPKSFTLVWPLSSSNDVLGAEGLGSSELTEDKGSSDGDTTCSIWLPEAPKGYVALGCVASPGRAQPPISSVFCILASLVSPCGLRDCISIGSGFRCPNLAFWRVDNAFGTFLPADPTTSSLTQRAYELRQLYFGFPEISSEKLEGLENQASTSVGNDIIQSERSSTVNSRRRFETVATFRLIWWNQGSGSRKKLSIWRPVVPEGMVYFGDIAVQGYEPPNTCVVFQESEDYDLYKAPSDFQLVGHIKKQRKTDSMSFWMPQAPPGFVTLGCIACKGTPKQSDFLSLRCIRTDMVSADQFSDSSVWDTSDFKFTRESFSIWTIGNELGTFIVWNGLKKPPKRFALKLSGLDIPSGSDDTVIDAEIRTFSAALFDDYGGLIVPLCNISLSGIGFGLNGRSDCLKSAVNFSLAARSYNDKYDSWEPLVESVDGSLRCLNFTIALFGGGTFMPVSMMLGLFKNDAVPVSFGYQYNPNAPGVASELRIASTRDLNLNVSVSNANMLLQAYASWNNLSHVQESQETNSPTSYGGSIIAVHQKRSYHIVPQNKLGKDIFIRASAVKGLPDIIKMPAGDRKVLKLPAPRNMLDSHLKGKLLKKLRLMLTIIVAEAELLKLEGLCSHQYSVGIRVYDDQSRPSQSHLNQQYARTRGTAPDDESSDVEFVKWDEVFFFKVDSMLLRGRVRPTQSYPALSSPSPIPYAEKCLVESTQDVDCCMLEITVNETGRGEPVGYYTSSLKQLNGSQSNSESNNCPNGFMWLELSPGESLHNARYMKFGRIRCAVFSPPISETENFEQSHDRYRQPGTIQISPTVQGPWTTVRLNYGSPAACWRLGNDVVASEVSVNDGNRYVNIRSLVSVRNNTDFTLDFCLKLGTANGANSGIGESIETPYDGSEFATDEQFESQKYNSTLGWVPCTNFEEGISGVVLPSGWEWVDEWQIDNSSVNTVGGWVYAPDFESLKWPESYNSLKYVNYARQRRWIRNRKRASEGFKSEIIVGPIEPGESVPLPLPCLDQSALYMLHLKPSNMESGNQYSWSSVVDMPAHSQDVESLKEVPEICLAALSESEKLLHCPGNSGSPSNSLRGVWFCLRIQATEIAKDIRFNPIQDWTIVVKPPVSIANYLPLMAETSLLEMQASGHFLSCYRGLSSPGESVNVYNADIRNPLYFTLLPQRGWLPIHEAILLSHPTNSPSKTISLRSSVSGRIVQIILEHNHNNERSLQPRIIKVYSPYWFGIARCPPLAFKLVDVSAGRLKKNPLSFQTKRVKEVILEEITEEEIREGYTIASALNFKSLGLSASIGQSVGEQFGPVKDLSPLGDMVISVRPFMTFTNRVGQSLLLKFSSEDEPKTLRVSDTRVSFVHRKADGPNEIQVRLHDTDWSFPIQIVKEDTFSLVLKKHDGTRRFLRTEIRGYEEGSRFIVVFRLGSANGPIRIENRTRNNTIRVRQTGFGDDAWIPVEPLSTANFSWEDPYGQAVIDTEVYGGSNTGIYKFDLDKAGISSIDDYSSLFLHVANIGDIKVVRFLNLHSVLPKPKEGSGPLMLDGNWGNNRIQAKMPEQGSPMELILELGVIGISIIDHRPRELAYLYVEKLFISYSTGYDGGTTSRFKLILGYMQLDNQLPLSVMPVLLAPEQTPDVHHPVFKMTITICNENLDGLQIYPYVYIRVIDKSWRLSIHEPIIWALVDFYNNLQLDRVPQNSNVTQVDPEIRVDLIDISEVRLKVSLETAPAQRPHGLLGVWSPILSAVGNTFKIQVHLRKVTHRDRFLRKSSVISAIGNRIWRDLIHNPLHLIFSVDVLGMTSSTLASLSRGFAELSTDGQFLKLRSKQVWSRRITGVGDGIVQGTEALAQGVAFGVSGVVRKPVESARQNGLLGLAHGLGQAFLGFFVQPVSGALDFFSLTVDGIGASCSRCLEILNNKRDFQRIRNPRAFHADHVLREYSEREALGQMILYLAEASRNFGCTEIFKEPSKFAWSDCYEEHFVVPCQRIVLVTNRRVMLLQCIAPDRMDRRPCKISWDVPWEEVMALELAKAGHHIPSHLIIHLKSFKRGFLKPKTCTTYLESNRLSTFPGFGAVSEKQKAGARCAESRVWKVVRYVSIGDIARCGSHPPTVAAIYRNSDKLFVFPVGYDLVWRNCLDDYKSGVSIWHPRAPEGYVSLGCVAVPDFSEPGLDSVYCVAESLCEETVFEEQKIWWAPESYPWACHIYQSRSDALQFVALRQPREESEWKPKRVIDNSQLSSDAQ